MFKTVVKNTSLFVLFHFRIMARDWCDLKDFRARSRSTNHTTNESWEFFASCITEDLLCLSQKMSIKVTRDYARMPLFPVEIYTSFIYCTSHSSVFWLYCVKLMLLPSFLFLISRKLINAEVSKVTFLLRFWECSSSIKSNMFTPKQSLCYFGQTQQDSCWTDKVGSVMGSPGAFFCWSKSERITQVAVRLSLCLQLDPAIEKNEVCYWPS